MSALIFLIKASIKGFFRKMMKRKSQFVMYIVMFGFLGFALIVSNIKDTAGDGFLPTEYITPAFAGLILVICWFAIKNGIKKGSSSYRMADVYLAFTSPISPRLILIYGFLRQLAFSILVVLWLGFQSMNLRNGFGFTPEGLRQFFMVAFLIALYMPISSMLLYSITLRREGGKVFLTRLFNGLFMALGIALIGFVFKTGDPLLAVQAVFGAAWFEFIPVLGWFIALLNATIFGFVTYSWISLVLLIGFLVFMLWLLLRSDVPFYEEVLKLTEEREKMRQLKKSGKSNLSLSFKKARQTTIKYKGTGAKAIFYRQLLEYKKTKFIFMDYATLFMLAVGIIGSYLLKKIGGDVQFIMYGAIYLNFIFAFSGKWVKELNNYYIYLLPDNPFAKIWYATAANHIKHGFDALALFIPAFIILDPHKYTTSQWIHIPKSIIML